MSNYISPGVYVKEVDVSDHTSPILDYPEFSREVFDMILSKVPSWCEFEYRNSHMRFYSENRIVSVDVVLYDGFARITSKPNLDRRIEYVSPNSIDEIASIVEAIITNNTPMAWHNIESKVINSYKELVKIFGNPK